jgi:hypothetical protein
MPPGGQLGPSWPSMQPHVQITGFALGRLQRAFNRRTSVSASHVRFTASDKSLSRSNGHQRVADLLVTDGKIALPPPDCGGWTPLEECGRLE